MSRGLGRIQRAIIEVVEEHDAPSWSLAAPEVARRLEADVSIVRRALPRLRREGLIAPNALEGRGRVAVESWTTAARREAYDPAEHDGKWWCFVGYRYRHFGAWSLEMQELHDPCCARWQDGPWSEWVEWTGRPKVAGDWLTIP